MFSLGEIEANCKKAARGAGLSWGLAEECGLIARHLSELGLPGADSIYFSLELIYKNKVLFLDQQFEHRKPSSDPIPSALLGIGVLDRLSEFLEKEVEIHHNIVGPLALFGALLRLLHENYSIFVKWSGLCVSIDQFGVSLEGKNKNPKMVESVNFCIRKNKHKILPPSIQKSRAIVLKWDELNVLTHRTYVPNSEKSRLLGAGAHDSDND